MKYLWHPDLAIIIHINPRNRVIRPYRPRNIQRNHPLQSNDAIRKIDEAAIVGRLSLAFASSSMNMP